jgi:hypothetical protein
MTLDSLGRMNLELQTQDGNPESAAFAKHILETWWRDPLMKPDMFEDLGLAILDAHDDEHGDVQEYEHSVIIGSDITKEKYKVESPDADNAALQEIETLQQEIGTALGNFFDEAIEIESPFDIMFSADGQLSFNGGALSSMESDAIQKVLDDINAYLAAKEAGEDTEDILSDEQLIGIGDKLLALKEIQDKFHDKSLAPKEGLRRCDVFRFPPSRE